MEYNNIPTKEEIKALKIEFNRQSFKEMLKREKGCVCTSCGSNEDIHYHHIVPLFLGGKNNLGNIVPLCFECHGKAHGGQNMDLYKRSGSGRKKLQPPKNYKTIIDKYLRCEIGNSECKQLFKMAECQKLSDKWWFRDYKKELGIAQSRNNIDIINTNGEMYANREAGYVTYKDGSTMVFNTNTYMQTHKEYKQLSFV